MKRRNVFKAHLSAYYEEVTGSRSLLTVEFPDGRTQRVLIDCGYFQEIDYRYLNYVDDLDPEIIDAMLITHNHIDHTGLIPKFVRNGYRNKIYTTKITKMLCTDFLNDCCNQQEENAADMKKRYPDEEYEFNPLYFPEDVEKTEKLIVGLDYDKTEEILPGIKVTFLDNAHLLGAAMILIECQCEGKQSLNYLFTGDYRPTSCFSVASQLPEWVRNLPLILVNESTYGNTKSDEIKKCFRENIIEAFSKKLDILIGAFSQGRMQEILYYFKLMQDEGIIPEDYDIYIDGVLGIKTTVKYQKILSWYNISKADFLPKGVKFVSPEIRKSIVSDGKLKIIITTSGMLSNGPARYYVPIFLQDPYAMIHLTGYAAEETFARALLDAETEEFVDFAGQKIEKNAVVKSTREFSSHATADQMIDFINQFNNIVYLIINHGEYDSKIAFENLVRENTSVKDVGTIERDNMYTFYQNADSTVQYTDVCIKRVPSKLNSAYQLNADKKKEEEKRNNRKKEKAQKRRDRKLAKRGRR